MKRKLNLKRSLAAITCCSAVSLANAQGPAYSTSEIDEMAVLLSPQEAVASLLPIASSGNEDAISWLVIHYAIDSSPVLNCVSARDWSQRGMEMKSAKVAGTIGAFYSDGIRSSPCFPRDYELAYDLLSFAAGAGDEDSESELAYLLDRGLGTEEDNASSFRLYRRAAVRGHLPSMARVAAMIADGEGTDQNSAEAYFWIAVSRKISPTGGVFNEAFGLDSKFYLLSAALSAEKAKAIDALVSSWKRGQDLQPFPIVERNAKRSRETSRSASTYVASSGSGFLVSENGLAVTNAHVVEGCLGIQMPDGRQTTLLYTDKEGDLAFLQIPSNTGHTSLAITSGQAVRLADPVLVAGFPLSDILSSSLNVTLGSVSALSGPQNDRRLFQITAPVQPGNSGGPVLDSSGHVVGVVVSKLDAVAVANLTGDIPQNVNFAISGEALREFLDLHGVDYRHLKSAPLRSNADVADLARSSTIQLNCVRSVQ